MKVGSIGLLIGIVGCAFAQPLLAKEAATFTEKVVYSFCSQSHCADGKYPSGLIEAKGVLYGTTTEGGTGSNCEPYGCGTVFSLDPNTGAEKVIHSFCSRANCKDGQSPQSGVIDDGGTLYGTTMWGGSGFAGQGLGTAYALDPKSGAEKVLYSFCSQQNCPDGQNPSAGLIAVKGTLYGTTPTGGRGYDDENGTAFALDPKTGAETVLYSFCTHTNCTDGAEPRGSLIDVKGMLYGTTLSGGAYSCGNGQACGTVFSLDPTSGAETVLYSFCLHLNQGCPDGRYPESAVIAVNGMLYGTTYAGGIVGCGPFGCGTVFSVDPNSGAEKVLYAFCSKTNCSDGANPFAAVIAVNGMLFGTTTNGGGTGCGGGGCGTVFSLDPKTGVEKVVYSFLGSTDGANPYVLIDVDGTLYGITNAGGGTGCKGFGCGTVFALKKSG